jgi:hypothetical protein
MTPTTYTTGRVISACTALSTALLLLALASPMAAQQLPQQPNAIRQKLAQAGEPAPAKPAAAPAKPAAAPEKPVASAKQAAAPAKAAGAPAKPAASAKPGAAAASAKPASASAKPVVAAGRRDPFDPLIEKNKGGPGIPVNLPPGKAGLMVATLNLDGIVRGPSGSMIAVVSNPQMRVYFLHQGDQLYDGQVGTITMEAVSFHQMGKDPFGAVIQRDLTRRLYPSPGEQP